MCPNIGECWGAGTATIMILGDTCTRGCRFCNVKTGSPRGEVDWLEPKRVSEAVRDMGWKYLVLTAVDRDDLADGGAAIFALTVRAIHKLFARGESRVPDRRFRRRPGVRSTSCSKLEPEVLAHNLETVRRLQSTVRDKRAGSRPVAGGAGTRAPRSGKTRYTKTSLMLGLGETEGRDRGLRWTGRGAGVDIFTMGQYLQPTKRHLPRRRIRHAGKVRPPARRRR